jgi:hypothetical protein
VPIAFELGWTIAILFGPLPVPTVTASDHLPSVHELEPDSRIDLELGRLGSLLARLKEPSTVDAAGIPADAAPLSQAWSGTGAASAEKAGVRRELGPRQKALQQAIRLFNELVLCGLARAGSSIELAYQVGRSLRDTVNPITHETEHLLHLANRAAEEAKPPKPPLNGPPAAPDPVKEKAAADALAAAQAAVVTDVKRQLSPGRIGRIQEWMATLACHFPTDAAPVVRLSLGRWGEFVGVTLDDRSPGRLSSGVAVGPVALRMKDALLSQGDVWRDLLAGDRTTEGLLTPEAYVHAGEATLSRTVRIAMRVLRHYWVAVLLVLAAMGGFIYLAAANLSGAAKVWTQIAAVVGALGAAGRGVTSALGRMATDAERPVFGLEKVDAMAWSITALPPVRLDPAGVRVLRKVGIARSSPLGRI